MPYLQYIVGHPHFGHIGGVHTCKSCWPPTYEWFDEHIVGMDYCGHEWMVLECLPTGFELMHPGYRCLVCEKTLTPEDLVTDVREPTYFELRKDET